MFSLDLGRAVQSAIYLYSGLTELRSLAEFLPGIDVWVLRPLERLFQFVQLVGSEGSTRSSLLAFERDPGFSLHVRTFLGTLWLD